MGVVRAIGRFWIVLLALAFGSIVAFSNRTPVDVVVPLYGTYEVALGLAFIAAFIFGATVVVFHFWIDVLLKTMEIRRLKKELRRLTPAEPLPVDYSTPEP